MTLLQILFLIILTDDVLVSELSEQGISINIKMANIKLGMSDICIYIWL